MAKAAFVQLSKVAYQIVRPLIFQRSASDAHASALRLLASLDGNPAAIAALHSANRLAFHKYDISAGGVWLPHPFILAAGFVKGLGYDDEKTALAAIRKGVNIIPGWRSLPALVGAVEFGSYTRNPRLGNTGEVMWRDTSTRSTQNRVGLKNPGAVAAAAFLALHRNDLPRTFGINIATSPGVDDLEESTTHIREAINAFIARGVYPTWFTLNISCPNTEDDPGDRQTGEQAHALTQTAVETLQQAETETNRHIPLWVKVSPNLAESQYHTLIQTFAETGVEAIISTNTLPHAAPGQQNTLAGVSGGRLHQHALSATRILVEAQKAHDYPIDIIGCGGVQDPASYLAYAKMDVNVVQYWSALAFCGPLVAALILDEIAP